MTVDEAIITALKELGFAQDVIDSGIKQAAAQFPISAQRGKQTLDAGTEREWIENFKLLSQNEALVDHVNELAAQDERKHSAAN